MESSEVVLESVRERVPPYVAYRTFINFLNAMARGIPSRIDRSVVSSLSGAVQGQLISTLRYLVLIGVDGKPNDSFIALVDAEGVDRQRILNRLINSSYRFVFSSELDLARATRSELEEVFAAQDVTGETLRKAIGFFLTMARDAAIRLSSQLTTTRRPAISIRRIRRAKGQGRGGHLRQSECSLGCAEFVLPKLPSFDPEWADELKIRWFDLFEALMDRDEQIVPERGMRKLTDDVRPL